MLQADRGEQPGGDDRAGDSGAHDGIAIIEQAVQPGGVGIAAEGGFTKPMLPINPRGKRLAVVGVARADAAGQREKFIARGAGGEDARLMANFGLDELLPKLLCKGFGKGELIMQPPDDLRMVAEGQEEGGGEMVAAADDEDGGGLGEFDECGVGVGDLGMIDEDDAEVFAGNLGDGLAVALEEQLLVAHGEMGRLAGDFEGAFNHGTTLNAEEREPSVVKTPLVSNVFILIGANQDTRLVDKESVIGTADTANWVNCDFIGFK